MHTHTQNTEKRFKQCSRGRWQKDIVNTKAAAADRVGKAFELNANCSGLIHDKLFALMAGSHLSTVNTREDSAQTQHKHTHSQNKSPHQTGPTTLYDLYESEPSLFKHTHTHVQTDTTLIISCLAATRPSGIPRPGRRPQQCTTGSRIVCIPRAVSDWLKPAEDRPPAH